MNRKQMIDLLVTRSSASRERLERLETGELEKALDKSFLAGIRREVLASPEVLRREQEIDEINADRQRMAQENQLSLIFRTPVNGKVAIDNQGNRSIIAGWLQEDQGESISAAWFQKVLKENPSLNQSLSWQSVDALDPRKQKEKDRRVFNEFARENGFSECESNHLLAKSVLEGGFDKSLLAQAVQSNALQLAEASPQEVALFRQDAIKAHNQRLLNMDIPTLRKLAREAGARGQVAPPPDETQRVRAAEEKFYGTAYPPLPDECRDGNGPEQVLNAEFIRNCSKETLRLLLKRYGTDQINEVLRTRTDGIYQY